MKKLTILVLAILATGCTDSELAKFDSYGENAAITCYSGGKVVLQDTSTGRVITQGATTAFKSQTTQRYVKSTADCVISTNG